MAAAAGQSVRSGWKKPELTAVDRRNIFFTCINTELTGGLKRGFFKQLSSNLPVAPRTVFGVWRELRTKYEENVGPIASINLATIMTTIPDTFFDTKKKNTGQNACKWFAEDIARALLSIPKSK
jgi:hypothetical protein